MVALIIVVAIAFLVLLFLSAAVKVAREYERGVVFRLGRLLQPPKGPGLFLLIPVIDRMVKVDLRTVTLNVPPQEVITKDNVPVRVNAVAYFRIVEPKAAIVQIENFMVATSQISQTTLRSVLGQHLLDELLSERDKINSILQQIIDEATSPWGIKVSIVEVKDVEIPADMQRAMARQAEAERERRAKIINAEGEFQAAERLKDAAVVIQEQPIALQLRYLQTLLEIGSANATTIVFRAPAARASGRRPRTSWSSAPSARGARIGHRRRRLPSDAREAAPTRPGGASASSPTCIRHSSARRSSSTPRDTPDRSASSTTVRSRTSRSRGPLAPRRLGPAASRTSMRSSTRAATPARAWPIRTPSSSGCGSRRRPSRRSGAPSWTCSATTSSAWSSADASRPWRIPPDARPTSCSSPRSRQRRTRSRASSSRRRSSSSPRRSAAFAQSRGRCRGTRGCTRSPATATGTSSCFRA